MNTALLGSSPSLAAMDRDLPKAHVPLFTHLPALIPAAQPHWFVSHVSRPRFVTQTGLRFVFLADCVSVGGAGTACPSLGCWLDPPFLRKPQCTLRFHL